ncbi:MAG TPA: hypothetical protein VFW47_03015 [Phenylobacterium sp.]|nr:hypothetical protein [Phenylobacterium sp.]
MSAEAAEAPRGLSAFVAQARRQLVRRRRPLTVALSVLGHLLVLLALLAPHADTPKVFDPEPMIVQLVRLPPPPPPPPEPAPPLVATEQPSPAKPPRRRDIFRKTPTPPQVAPLAAGDAPTAAPGVEVSEAQLAGAATAGSGATGGACNMPRRLQNALRKDRMVQAAVANAHRGKPIMVWDGDWIRRPDQEGNGLAAVREAMMWEIAFAPAACRAEPVNGLVLISLNDSPGSARLVVGSGRWRWSDMLFARTASGSDASSRR